MLRLSKTRYSVFSAIMLILLTTFSHAYSDDSTLADKLNDNDLQASIERGKAKSATCIACHGVDGISVIPTYPNLAGQIPTFIYSQLQQFKSGDRENAIMAGQVLSLSDEDMMDIDNYYSSLSPSISPVIIDENNEELIEKIKQGEKLYRGGDAKFEIAACMSCHLISGNGIPNQYPKISNQPIEYLQKQLTD